MLDTFYIVLDFCSCWTENTAKLVRFCLCSPKRLQSPAFLALFQTLFKNEIKSKFSDQICTSKSEFVYFLANDATFLGFSSFNKTFQRKRPQRKRNKVTQIMFFTRLLIFECHQDSKKFQINHWNLCSKRSFGQRSWWLGLRLRKWFQMVKKSNL